MQRFKKDYGKISFFLLPALFFYIILLVYPIIQGLGLSFFTWNGISGVDYQFVGFKNYASLFNDAAFVTSFKNFVVFIVISLLVQIPGALLLALLLNAGLKGTRIYKAAFFMPIIFSATAVSLMWKFILFPDTGLFDMILKGLGLEDQIVLWLADPKYSLFTLIFISCWQNIGVPMIIFLAGLAGIDQSYYEAAKVDGAGSFQRFTNITIPMLWGTIKTNVILLIISTTKVFDIVYVLTKGGPNNATDVLATYMYKSAFDSNRHGYASAIAVIIFLVSFALTGLSNFAMRRESIEM